MTTDTTLNKEGLDQSFILSRDPAAAMQDMMSAIDALRNIYIEENEALTSADTKRFLDLQERKMAAARDYQHGAEQIIARKDEFKDISPETKEKFSAMQKDFSLLASKNLRSIHKMRRGVQRLNDRIMTLAREKVRTGNVNYGASGSLEPNDRRLSIGLNESV